MKSLSEASKMSAAFVRVGVDEQAATAEVLEARRIIAATQERFASLGEEAAADPAVQMYLKFAACNAVVGYDAESMARSLRNAIFSAFMTGLVTGVEMERAEVPAAWMSSEDPNVQPL